MESRSNFRNAPANFLCKLSDVSLSLLPLLSPFYLSRSDFGLNSFANFRGVMLNKTAGVEEDRTWMDKAKAQKKPYPVDETIRKNVTGLK